MKQPILLLKLKLKGACSYGVTAVSGAPDSAADAESLPLVAVGPSASDFASEIIVELPKDKLDKVLNDFQSINEVRKAETPRPALVARSLATAASELTHSISVKHQVVQSLTMR